MKLLISTTLYRKSYHYICESLHRTLQQIIHALYAYVATAAAYHCKI